MQDFTVVKHVFPNELEVLLYFGKMGVDIKICQI
jgi:hypothetical protein